MTAVAGDIIRLAFEFLCNGSDQMVNVWDVELDTVPGGDDDGDIMAKLLAGAAAAFYDEMVVYMSDLVIGNFVRGFNRTQNTVMPVILNTIDGTDSAEILPFQTTPLLYFNGTVPHVQGRKYFPAVCEDASLGNGDWAASFVTDMVSQAAHILANVVSSSLGFHYVVVLDDNPATVMRPTAGGVAVAPRTQRRRTLGRGS